MLTISQIYIAIFLLHFQLNNKTTQSLLNIATLF